MRNLFFILLALCHRPLSAQPLALSGVINHYGAVSGIDTCLGRLEVSDTTGFRAGMSAILFQMQGASISTANNINFGSVINMNAAGRFECILIDSVAPGALFVAYRLLNRYDPGGKVQVVTFPRFYQAVVTDTLFAQPWNGSTGGVIAFAVTDTLSLNAPIVATGAGFRGGAAFVAPVNNCTWLVGESDYSYPYENWRGSFKGEGIAAPDSASMFGRGPLANGGGGGNDHNSGGGGGANYGAGGQGGENDEPSLFGCDGYYPGLGGRALAVDVPRLFPGGGGGAGHSNNNLSSAGGNGGGIILIEAGSVTGSNPLIVSNGQPGQTANGDGGGGGGAGGAIWLKSAIPPDSIHLAASGAAGGDTYNNNQNRCFGPGGGGGGGRIICNFPLNANLAGGPAGSITGSANICNGYPGGAGSGAPGAGQQLTWEVPRDTVQPVWPEWTANPLPAAACTGETVDYKVATTSGIWQYQWEINSGNGWLPIGAGVGFSGASTPVLTVGPVTPALDGALFRCRVAGGNCDGIISDSASLQVIPAPTASFSAAANGNNVLFTNTSANAAAFWWDFGDGTFSAEIAPQHTYLSNGSYWVTLFAISVCDTAVYAQLIPVATRPVAAFAAPDSVRDCSFAQVVFSNQSSPNATGFLWLFPGGIPATSSEISPAVTYSGSGTFTATLIAMNAAGADTTHRTIVVELLGYPQAAFEHTLIGNGLVQFSNSSQHADTYTWYFGDGSAPEHTADALHQYASGGVFTVTLVADNYCGTSILQKTIEIELAGIGETAGAGGVRVYPNPAGETVVVDCSLLLHQPVEVRLCDLTGKTVWRQPGGAGPVLEIPLAGRSAGRYQVLLFTKGGVIGRKVVKY